MPRRHCSRTCIDHLLRGSALLAVALLLLAGQLDWPAGAAELKMRSLAGIDPLSVSAFANAAIPTAMRQGKIPGAVFVVVSGGQLICEKAFGVADLKTWARVSPDLTLFRVASISKILTAASVLQLAGAHRLDLRRNVNSYLARIHIARAFGEPITTADLLTHSSGFDDCQFGYAARTAAGRLPLADYLAKYQPVRVRPPGLFSVYDNYGYTLAGYLVQRVSGMPFADFVQERILGPLDMTHSSFMPGAALRQQLATGYWLDGETPCACQPHYVNIVPAAGFCTTASDMAHFLVALLANQRPGGGQMFSASVLRGLKTREFAAGPQMFGRCYGFDRVSLAGRTALQQTGQWPGFDSVLLLFPKANCGIFLAYNLCDYERLTQSICRRFAEQFIPPDARAVAVTVPPEAPAMDLPSSFVGSYLTERAQHDVPALEFPRELDVTESPGGDLEIGGRLYRPIGLRAFEEMAVGGPEGRPGGQRVMFLAANGSLHLIMQDGVYRRVGWLNSTRGRILLLRVATLILVSGMVLLPVMAFVTFILNKRPQSPGPSLRTILIFSPTARMTAFAACVLALWFELSFLLVQGRLRPFAEFYGFPSPVKHLLWALPVLMLFVAAVAFFCGFAWYRRLWHPVHRVHYTLLVAALGVFLYAFCSLHLLAAEAIP